MDALGKQIQVGDDFRDGSGEPEINWDAVSSASPHSIGELSRDAAGLQAGQILASRYQVEREVGRGAMGVVYVARDLQLLGSDSTRVVIKVLNDEALGDAYTRKKFFQEFESLTRVNHPNVVKVLGRGMLPGGVPFFAMEFVNGESLRAAIPAGGMDLVRAAHIVRQIGNALTAVHERGILHCDLKPANIMLQVFGHEDLVKLIDFGVAKVTDSAVLATGATRVLGTLNYASPEHFTGRLSPMSDIYAFGLIAYEIVTGQQPFSASYEADMCLLQSKGVKTGPRDLRPAVSIAAEQAILKALSRDPAERYPSARAFGEALGNALAAGPIPLAADHSSASRSEDGRTAGTCLLQAVYLLFVEIIDFTALPIDRQVHVIRELEQVVRGALASTPADPEKRPIVLPSGEGVGAVFTTDPTAPLQSASDIAAELRSHADVRYRIGVHSGPAYVTTDGEKAASVAGGCITMTKLIAQYGDAGHILVSADIANFVSQLSFWAPHLSDLGEQAIAGDLRIRLYSFANGDAGNARLPVRCVPESRAQDQSRVSGTPAVSPAARKVEPAGEREPAGLASRHLDEGATRVLAAAIRLAGKSGAKEVTTLHLLKAMLDGSDARLRRHLSAKGIPPDKLAAYLMNLLAKLDGPGSNSVSGDRAVKFSRNSEEVLVRALRIAAAEQRDRCSEADLLQAVLEKPGASIRNVLRGFGISLSETPAHRTSERNPALAQAGDIRIGPIKQENCAPEVWERLLRVVGDRHVLTTVDLISGPLASVLARFGLRSDIGPRTRQMRASDNRTDIIECSRNAHEILSKALTIARPAPIGTSTLLAAFIEHGGGSSGDAMRARGIRLDWLTSKLFVDNGRLEVAQLGTSGRKVIELALDAAHAKHHALLSRDHLLYGLLSLEDGCLCRRLLRLQQDGRKLASLFNASMAPAVVSGRPIALILRDMESGLVDVLCQAERISAELRGRSGDECLLRALITVGMTATIREFLAVHGVVIERLTTSPL
jgi:hypothetical protein